MNNLSLYQITSRFPIIMENEEIEPELKEELERELTVLLQEKSQNIIGYARNIDLTIEAMEIEEKRISEQKKLLKSRAEKFKQYVKDCMEKNGITKIETALGSLTIAKNPISIEIINESEVPSEYKTEVITVKVDKSKIKDNFKETGEIPTGVNIIANKTTLRIK